MPNIKDTDGDYYGSILAQLKVNDKTAMGLFSWLKHNCKTATPDERLAIYKKVREQQVISPEGIFYLIAWMITEDIGADRLAQAWDRDFKHVNAKIEAVKTAHGLAEDDHWPVGQGPDEYKELMAEWQVIHDRIMYEAFRDCGEIEMGEMYLNRREQFDRLVEAGETYLASTPDSTF